MDENTKISRLLGQLDDLCPSGYAIALHIRYTTPTFLFQTYPKDWMEYYSQNGLVLHDPTVRWGLTNTGTRYWHALRDDDAMGVFEKAEKFGMRYGFVRALMNGKSRTVASFARGDRDYSDDEVAQISEILDLLDRKTADPEALPADERAELKRLSINLTHGA